MVIKTCQANNLKPGMYVTQITKQTGEMRIKTKGWIRCQSAIDKLIQNGVVEVTIDTKKQLPADSEPAAEEALNPNQTVPQAKRTDVDTEISKAKVLYKEAKAFQQKMFDSIRAGKSIDTKDSKNLAEPIVQSIFDNQDALIFMSRIREKDQYLLEHSVNVSILATVLAKHLQLDADTIH